MDINQILIFTGIGFIVTLVIGLFVAHYVFIKCKEYEDEDNDCKKDTAFKDEE